MKIVIIGAGSWGTTLAILLQEKQYDVSLWVRSNATFQDIIHKKKNTKYTFETPIPKQIKVFHDIRDMGKDVDIILFAVPSDFLEETATMFYKHLGSQQNNLKAVVNVAKGIDPGTGLRPSQIIQRILPKKIKNLFATMSGPNISKEVLKKMPSVTVISSTNEKILPYLQEIFSNDYFRAYTNNDLIGVEIAGAVKNIIAIAAGISDGLGYGANAKASLITRGLYEMAKFGTLLGANAATFSGVAGMGDLIATCISPHSRNRTVGEKIAKGHTIEEIQEKMYMIAEGIKTTKAVYDQSSRMDIEMPVTESLYKILYMQASPFESVEKLMKRKFKPEIEF